MDRPVKITPELLKHLSPGLTQQQAELAANKLEWAAKLHGINTPLRIAHFVAQLSYESSFIPQEENLNYSAARLAEIFPGHFKNADEAAAHVGSPESIANTVYAHVNGNRDYQSGDGYRYRGRGMIQLTGRANYREYGKLIGFDLEKQPELCNQYGISALVAAAYWTSRNLNMYADRDSIVDITRLINGRRMHGLDARKLRLAKAKRFLGL